MKITQITYSRGASVNRGNFNSERIDVSATVQIDDEETPEQAYDRAHDWVSVRVKLDMKRQGEKSDG